jgi:hypothetical protein
MELEPTPGTPNPEADTRWVLALYGAVMLAVQGLEHTISYLYLLADYAKSGGSGGGARRQWIKGFHRSWHAFQQGSARMKLNDQVRGIKDQLDPQLYEELDHFLAVPRAQLAHRFLLERLRTPVDIRTVWREEALAGMKFTPGTVLELLQVTLHANELNRKLMYRAEEIRRTLPPPPPEVPDEVIAFATQVARMAMFKEFPEALQPPKEQ